MRANHVTECAVGDTRLVLAPLPQPPVTLNEPALTPEQQMFTQYLQSRGLPTG